MPRASIRKQFLMKISPLNRKIHDRTSFDCGDKTLNNYLKAISNQHHEKDLARTFVLTSEIEPTKIKGFYSLALCTIDLDELPQEIGKKYPKELYCVLIGRLAISQQYQRQGLGSILLVDAVRKAINSSGNIPIPMIIVDAKHDIAKSMYQGLGFSSFSQNEYRLFMTMANAKAVISLVDNK